MNNKMISIGWEAFITGSQKELLPSMGWKMHWFGQEQRELNLRADVPDWEERTWADQTFLQAAYGFQKDGAIVLTMGDVRKDRVLEALLHGTRRETPQGAYPEPGWALPGADTRIRNAPQGPHLLGMDEHQKRHSGLDGARQFHPTDLPGGMGNTGPGGAGTSPILRVGREGKNLRLATRPRPTAPVGHIASDAATGRTTATGRGMAGRVGQPVSRHHPHPAPP